VVNLLKGKEFVVPTQIRKGKEPFLQPKGFLEGPLNPKLFLAPPKSQLIICCWSFLPILKKPLVRIRPEVGKPFQ